VQEWSRLRFCARRSFNQRHNKKIVSEPARRKGDIVDNNSKDVLKKRAEASFKKEERFPQSAAARLEYEAKDAIDEKTARLRALRLAKEAAESG
jgi:hypothetical protein